MRGKGTSNIDVYTEGGITPAYAGKRDWHVHEATRPKDHPRLCGEKLHGQNGSECVIGSPPPMRGKEIAFLCLWSTRMDHPRLCGEKFICQHFQKRKPGSPPPMRGKVKLLDMLLSFSGITPAYAGKRLTLYKIWQTVRDHPRLCGEKFWFRAFPSTSVGSPPPMRGKDDLQKLFSVFFGITPAYAGKSFPFCFFWYVLRDHPRLCGEKCTKISYAICVIGSPPPMRGKGPLRQFQKHGVRITPAYAGKSVLPYPQQSHSQDHPRLCGEKVGGSMAELEVKGSPPPMRGKGLSEENGC